MRAGDDPRATRAGEPIRVLVVTWGYSIHAERRIRVFAEDPRFTVSVASGHAYDIPGARLIPLSKPWHLASIPKRIVHAVTSRVTPLHALLGLAIAAWDLVLLRSAVRDFRPQVVLLQTLLYPSFLGLFLPDAVPIAITFWNGDLTWHAKSSGLERLFKRRIVARGLRRASTITVNSTAAERTSVELGAPPSRVHVVRYPGVDTARFFPGPKEEARRALGLTARRVVLWPRGLGGYLNSDVLVEASPAIVRAHPDVVFLMLSGVGGDDERSRHVQRLEELGTADRFRWVGQVQWEAMPTYYRAADAMVSISSNDSLPSCMTEAMACGVPLVLGDIPPIREWIAHGENGLLVPPRDPEQFAKRVVEVLSGDERPSADMVRRNLALVREVFSAERNCARVKGLVEQAARPPPA